MKLSMDIRKIGKILGYLLLINLGGYSQMPVALPQVVPPPADAASLGKYSDVPINLNVGLPNIAVPIYEIKTPRLRLPIELNYYASGIKVDDMASWVGLGWSLEAGGVITRTVKGLDDFITNGFYHRTLPFADSLSQANDYGYLDFVSNGVYDTEPDNFFYNFAGHTGKYVFGTDKKIININYQEPLKIQYNADSLTFTIFDGGGNQYDFTSKERTASYYTDEANPAFPNHSQNYISSWYLKKITSFDKSDSIVFNYYTDNELIQSFFNYSIVLGQSNNVVTNGITSKSFIRSNPQRLQSIVFRNGKINFYSSGPRTDLDEAKLDSVIISSYNSKSQNYLPLKKVRFIYDYYASSFPPLSTGYRLKLDSVVTVGSSHEDGGSYAFTYDSTMLPLIGSTGKDLFNYYNGRDQNSTLIPSQALGVDTVLFGIPGADRHTYNNYLQAGVLKSIHYPTGGRADFSYESNKYALTVFGTITQQRRAAATGTLIETDTVTFVSPVSAQAIIDAVISHYSGYTPSVQTRPQVSFTDMTVNPGSTSVLTGDPNLGLISHTAVDLLEGHTYRLVAQAFENGHVFSNITVTWQQPDSTITSANGGGLRISQVNHYDVNGRFATSELYKYGAGESGVGYIPTSSLLLNTFQQTRTFNHGTFDSGTGSCIPTITTNQLFFGSSIYDIFNLSGASLSYPEVSRYIIDSSGNSSGKTIYDYSVYHNSSIPALQSYFEGLTIENSGWQGGSLLSQTDYTYTSDGYIPVRMVINRYDSVSGPSGRGLKANYQENISGCYSVGALGEQYYWFDYPILSGSVLLASTSTYDYDLLNPVKYVLNTENLSYDNLEHLQPTKITRSRSDGTIQTTITRYPQEVDSLNNLSAGHIAAIDSMVSRHNLVSPIQTQILRDSNRVNLMRYDYKIWPNDLILQDSVEVQNANFPIEKRIQYSNYDSSGNILQVSKVGDVNHAYVWDYNKAYPVSEVVNVQQSDIAYTSFEADGTGGWSIGSGSRDIIAGITGSSSYVLSGNISRSGLTTGTTYIVSYWTQNSSPYSITGTIASYPTKGKTVNGWTYFMHKVTGQSTITISGSGHIDELRLYPASAQMTTYTYDPLVGMTSQCDVNNRITYYEYDGLQRLKRIRDQDHNILKTYEYQYQASSGCGANCYIVAMQTLAGSNTLSYPVGVFNASGKLLGNATNQAGYISLWNADTANSHRGTLAAGPDSLHFQITLNTGKTLPPITGCRYYQVDLAWDKFDGVRSGNGAYIDFGDGAAMATPKNWTDTPSVLAPNTIAYTYIGFRGVKTIYLIHTYTDTSLKTLTFYHNDAREH
ncbi:MAG TPA: hypothetical protein VE035_15440, partial [Puia sp.]|nr:hypothetical protein [Puia sp.]